MISFVLCSEVSEEQKSPPTWRGKQHSDYNIGPGFMKYGWQLRVKVNLINVIHTYYNVISAIRGREEPGLDKYLPCFYLKKKNYSIKYY